MASSIVPQPNPSHLILPQSSILQDHFLKSYTPSPQDGKFATDLLFALDHHTALTLLQKIFLIVTITIPGSIGWKLSLFEQISSFSFAPFIATVIGGLFVIAIIYLIRKFAWRIIAKKEPLVFLELTFPSIISKSAYATEQLFSLMHTLAGQRRFMEWLLGVKKQYSLEIVASREDGIRYILVLSGADASIVQKSLLSYLPGLKIKEISDYLPSGLKMKSRVRNEKSGLIELKLAGDFVLPLQKYKTLNEHDPIAYLTGNMTKLKPQELIVFQAIVTPLTRSSHRRTLNHLNLIQHRIYTNSSLSDKLFGNVWQRILDIPLAILKFIAKIVEALVSFGISMVVAAWDTKGDSVPFFNKKQSTLVAMDIQNPYEQQLRTEVKEKIDQPMFETSLRLFVRSTDFKQYHSRISGFLASFGSLGSSYQSLVLKTKNLFTLIFPPLSSFLLRQVSIFGNPILSVSELTDIYHFPYTETTKTEDLVKTKSQPLPAPLSFKQTTTHFDNVFAKNTYGGSDTVIGQTLEERRRHTYILGATGSGKTTLISSMIYRDILNGKGVAVLDPHGQLIEKLLQVIPEERIKDVVWFAPDDDGYPIALNLLELPKGGGGQLTTSQLQKQKSLVASSIISIIEKFYDAKFFGPRMEYVLRNAILTALETPDPTLQTILDLLTKTTYRKSIVRGLRNKVLQDFWVNEFEKLGSMQRNNVISPITNKIGGLLSSPINYNILIQDKSKLDFDEIINSGKILLCDLSKGKIGEDESSFFGSLIIAKIQLAALRRALIPEEKRKDFYLYVDEFQNFATSTFAELVSEARKYRLATILAHQSISQIENRDIVKVILANVGTVICFKTANPEDEQFILPIFSPEVMKHEIANLPLYNFYMKISVGQAQDSFVAEADNFTMKGNEKTAKDVIDWSRNHYATPIEATVEKEMCDTEMRQSGDKTVSHLSKSSETINGQFQDQIPDNFSIYPLQEGNKDGIGSKENINKKNASPNTPKPNLPITQQELQIILLLYRFRFLNRTQIQQYLNHKNHKRILTWLNDLIEKKYIKTVNSKSSDTKSKAKIYCLGKNSILILAAQNVCERQSLQKLYRESERSDAFINRSLMLANISLEFQSKVGSKDVSTMQVKSDYSVHSQKELLDELNPHAYIKRRKSGMTKYYFLEIFADLPRQRLQQRIKKYLSFYQSNEWEGATGRTFPIILIICPNDEVFEYIKRYAKTKLRELDEPSLKVQVTTAIKVKKSGITGDIWVKV